MFIRTSNTHNTGKKESEEEAKLNSNWIGCVVVGEDEDETEDWLKSPESCVSAFHLHNSFLAQFPFAPGYLPKTVPENSRFVPPLCSEAAPSQDPRPGSTINK